MEMELELSKDISKSLERASQELGLKEKEIIVRAIKLYLYNIKEYLNFKEELEAWEMAGFEDSLNFEKKI
jgi:hypothetical protein